MFALAVALGAPTRRWLVFAATAVLAAGCGTGSRPAPRTPSAPAVVIPSMPQTTATPIAVSSPSRAPSPRSSAVDPGSFAAGACVEFPPSPPQRATTVFLDAGHGGPDPGGSGTTTAGRRVQEKTLDLAVVLETATRLQAAGFAVVVSRVTDTSVAPIGPGDLAGGVFTADGEHADLAARIRCANAAHADLMVSVHFNIGASTRNAGTLSAYDAVRPFAQQNFRLATLIQSGVLEALNSHGWAIPDAGVVADTAVGTASSADARAYGHLLLLGPPKPGYLPTASAMPGSLIEPLFLTDPFEADIAESAPGRASISGGIVAGIERYLLAGQAG